MALVQKKAQKQLTKKEEMELNMLQTLDFKNNLPKLPPEFKQSLILEYEQATKQITQQEIMFLNALRENMKIY